VGRRTIQEREIPPVYQDSAGADGNSRDGRDRIARTLLLRHPLPLDPALTVICSCWPGTVSSGLCGCAGSVVRQSDQPDRVDTATRMGSDADFSDRGKRAAREPELARKVDPIDELMRIVGVQAESRRHAAPRRRRFQTVSGAPGAQMKPTNGVRFFAARIACGGREDRHFR
jgi:hypothetical protein